MQQLQCVTVQPVVVNVVVVCRRVLQAGESHQQVYLSQNGKRAFGSVEHGAEQENTWELRENKHFQRRDEEEQAG